MELPDRLSICIPQYNRIEFLLKSLKLISIQDYPNLEIVISDDCSTDNTFPEISALKVNYKFPIIYERNEINLGYDRNYRRCIEMATGKYVIVIGNDDTINPKYRVDQLMDFLRKNNFPDIGFCNMIEENAKDKLIERAITTNILGTGADIAMKYYSCFSFVGGLIYKRTSFLEFNNDRFDGSIYAQTYLGVKMVSSGCMLFSIKDPLVIKDIIIENKISNSYKDTIAKSWKNFKVVDGGLPSVINVLINALHDVKADTQIRLLFIFKRIYTITYPFWILDYKENGAMPEAFGLIVGLYPGKNRNFKKLNFLNRIYIYINYFVFTIGAILMPVAIFKKIKSKLYRYFKK